MPPSCFGVFHPVLHDLKSLIVSQELAAGLEKAQKFKQYQQQQMTGECWACVGTRQLFFPHPYLPQTTFGSAFAVKPKTMSDVVGTGIELHVPRDPTEMAVLACMPAEHAKRTVVIAPRTNKTLQSGGATGHLWQITWKNEERWSNPLMGWTSTADPLSNLKLSFDTEEEAVAFAQKNGWKFEKRAPVPETTVELGTMTYAHAFLPKKVAALVREKGPKNGVFTQVR